MDNIGIATRESRLALRQAAGSCSGPLAACGRRGADGRFTLQVALGARIAAALLEAGGACCLPAEAA